MQTTTNPTGTKFWFDSQIFEVLVSAEDTGGTMSLLRQELVPGYAPPTHVHEREDQTLYVLEGSITAWLDPNGDDHTELSLSAGESVHLPRGVAHAFKAGDQGAKLLEINTPGGFEQFHVEAGIEAPEVRIPDPTEPDIPKLVAAIGPYDAEFVGPPMS